MKRSVWLGAVAAIAAALGTGCGSSRPLEAFKDRTFRVDFGPDGTVTTPEHPEPVTHYSFYFSLPPASLGDCDSLAPGVVATVNGDSNVMNLGGGCTWSGSLSPVFYYEVEPGAVPESATLVLSDSTHRMEIEVENMIAAYGLDPRRDDFDTNVLARDGANPIARGEVLVFDRVPGQRAPSSLDGLISQGTPSGSREFPLAPTVNGAELRFTVPGGLAIGQGELLLDLKEAPAILRCEGARTCEAEVGYHILTSVTVTR